MFKSLSRKLRSFLAALIHKGDPVHEPRYPHKGGRYFVYIKKLSRRGFGLATVGNFKLVVPRAVPGDLLLVQVEKIRGKHVFGHIEKIIRASKLRSSLSCPQFDNCGFCNLDHLKYSYQLRLKRKHLRDYIQDPNFGGRDLAVNQTRGSAISQNIFLEIDPYLDKRRDIIFHAMPNVNISTEFSLEKCPRLHPHLRSILISLRHLLKECEVAVWNGTEENRPVLKHLRLRYFPSTDEAVLAFHCHSELKISLTALSHILALRHPVLSSIILQPANQGKLREGSGHLLYGRPSVYEKRGQFMIETDAGLPNSSAGETQAYKKLADFVSRGSGLVYHIAESMCEDVFWVAARARSLYVLGLDKGQRRLLEDNLITNNFYNVNLVSGNPLERISFLQEKSRADSAVLNVKNQKLFRNALKRLVATGLQRIAFITENASSLARHADFLVAHGYRSQGIIPIDASPHRQGVRGIAMFIHHRLQRQIIIKRTTAAAASILLLGLFAFGGTNIFKQDTLSATTTAMEIKEPDFHLYLNKNIFYRYEMIESRIDLDSSIAGEKIASAQMLLRRGNTEIKSVGGLIRWPLQPDQNGSYRGTYPLPFNPALGNYVFKVELLSKNGKKIIREHEIKIVSRRRDDPPAPTSVMTLETLSKNRYSLIPNPIGPGRGYQHIASWGQYMGAEAIWHCVGFSPSWKKNNTANPWDEHSLKMMRKLAPEIHARGMKYGVWLQAFAVIGGVSPDSPYKHSHAYNHSDDQVVPIHHPSISDEKRIQHIIELIKLLDKEPNVDFIGLDYIRTGLGGYELIEEFVTDMSVSVPETWPRLNNNIKMKWLASQLEIEKNQALKEKWHWWRAHRTALVVKRILDQAKPSKPVWAFTLGWRQGREHGQDPGMMVDAGLAYDAVMLYEVARPAFNRMNKDWTHRYLHRESLPLMIGQCVDWNLLQHTIDPPAPQELLQRNVDVIKSWLPNNSNLGIFWHDLSRALFGRTGPYTAKEWVIAGGASATNLKQMSGHLELYMELMFDPEVESFKELRLPVKLVNSGEEPIYDIEISLLDTQSLSREEISRVKLNTLMPAEEVVLHHIFSLPADYKPRGNPDSPQMIAFLINHPGQDDTPQRDFFFRYIKLKNDVLPIPPAGILEADNGFLLNSKSIPD